MRSVFSLFFLVSSLSFVSFAKEPKQIALTFDDAPVSASEYFDSTARTEELIRKLKILNVQGAMIFSNPCNGEGTSVEQMKKYVDAGHFIGNHTCSHPRFDAVGYSEFSKDARKADQLLRTLFFGQKFFRFPYLNEGKNVRARDRMRRWLVRNQYRNGMVTVDNDEYVFSWAIHKAKEQGKLIDFPKLEKLFVEYLMGAVDFYDDLAVKALGYSPKHVLLLHEVDATVMFIESVVQELRLRGWKIISASDAYADSVYLEQPRNINAGNGIISQISYEKTGVKVQYNRYNEIKAELTKVLGIQW